MRTKVIGFLLAAAVAASAAFLLLRDRGKISPMARITRDGVVLEEIALDQVEEPRRCTLEDGRGRNTIEVERGRIRVAEADCPDQVCVRRGWSGDGTTPIVCLPHKLMIEIVGEEGGLDGGAG